ncbi:WxcM-like domain-containing protein [Flavobacteriaceae bacterium KMM 6897]|nr:WxcM-like domain-containing protein [Flavobacteriaceae bacterium KMM 6897]
MNPVNQIEGSQHIDERGRLTFFNAFDMREIVRFYEIAPSSTHTIRAWQGHQKEKKWFYCTAGAFIVNLKKIIDDSSHPINMVSQRFELNANNPIILAVPGGYASGFKSMVENSKLMVFSNCSLDNSKNDDIRFPLEQWKAQW